VKRAAVLLLLLGCASQSKLQAPAPRSAQQVAAIAKVCEEPGAVCRKDVRIHLRRAKNKPDFDETLAQIPPTVSDWAVSLYPGDNTYVEAAVFGDELKLIKAVPAVEHPERTLVFELKQMPGSADMMLHIHNPFDRLLKLDMRAAFLDDREGELRKTSSCPVLSGRDAYETWPQPIYSLMVAKPRFLPSGAPMTCN
jgi:hypothetical protein